MCKPSDEVSVALVHFLSKIGMNNQILDKLFTARFELNLYPTMMQGSFRHQGVVLDFRFM
jgi:hypothetical protein